MASTSVDSIASPDRKEITIAVGNWTRTVRICLGGIGVAATATWRNSNACRLVVF